MGQAKRWLMLCSIFVMQSCTGGLYGWSVFVPILTAEEGKYGFSGAQTQIVFGLTIACFTLSMIFAGRVLPLWGARVTALIGGILFAGGYAITALSGVSWLGLVTGIGVVSGAAIGFGYVAALKSGMLWFPAHRGLVTGVAVAGFGGGAIVLSQVGAYLLEIGMSLVNIFWWICLVYGILICLCALLLFAPPKTIAAPAPLPSLGALLRDIRFWLLGWGIFAGTFAGLLIVGNLKPLGLAHEVATRTAILSISFFAVGNAVGRLTWGWVFDKIGYRSVPASLLMAGIVIPAMFLLRGSPYVYLMFTTLVGFAFGGCFVVYAAEVARVYGVEGVNCVYPLLFLLYGLSALLGPFVGGWIFDATGGFAPAVMLSSGLALFAALVCWMFRSRMNGGDGVARPHAPRSR